MDERPYSKELGSYEDPKIEQYSDFINYVTLFDVAQKSLNESIVQAVNAQDPNERAYAISYVHRLKYELTSALEELAIFTFETIDEDEAIKIWTTIVHGDLLSRNEFFTGLHPDAGFIVWENHAVGERAKAYAKGRAKLQGEDIDAIQHNFQQYEGAEYIHELTDGELDWTNLSEVSEEDEFAQWVHDEYDEELGKQIERLLTLAHTM